MKQRVFTAHHVHEAYPWISGTSLFNRIKAGLIPYEREARGTGTAYEFNLPQLIHIGVVDALHTFGIWRAGGTKQAIEFAIEPPKDETIHQCLISFYIEESFMCWLIVDARYYKIPGERLLRNRRAQRTFYVKNIPDSGNITDIGYNLGGYGIDERGEDFTVVGSSLINVGRLYIHTCNKLGIDHSKGGWE